MIPDRFAFIAPLALVPALIGCHSAQVPAPPPLSATALAAVVADPGDTGHAELAQAIDAVFSAPDAGETRALLVWHDGKLVAERSFADAAAASGVWDSVTCCPGVLGGPARTC